MRPPPASLCHSETLIKVRAPSSFFRFPHPIFVSCPAFHQPFEALNGMRHKARCRGVVSHARRLSSGSAERLDARASPTSHSISLLPDAPRLFKVISHVLALISRAFLNHIRMHRHLHGGPPPGPPDPLQDPRLGGQSFPHPPSIPILVFRVCLITAGSLSLSVCNPLSPFLPWSNPCLQDIFFSPSRGPSCLFVLTSHRFVIKDGPIDTC